MRFIANLHFIRAKNHIFAENLFKYGKLKNILSQVVAGNKY
jgi:hypothetical protein